MKTLQQIQVEQVSIGELRPDQAMKRIEEINRAGMGVGGLNIYSFKSPKPCEPPHANYREFPKNKFESILGG